MHHAPLPLTRDLVLIGGGHTHALVLRKWGMNPLPGARVTVINPGPTAPYSGMLPGFVAGHYPRDALDIDLIRLARFAGARIIAGAVERMDAQAREVHVAGRPPIAYDVASVNVGITSDMPDLPGFSDHAIPAKPLGPFAARWAEYLSRPGPARVAVIGGGVAGAELALAMAHALQQAGREAKVALIDNATAFQAVGDKAARQLRTALSRLSVDLLENCQIARIGTDHVALQNGDQLEAHFVTGAAGARPYGWLATSGLATEGGYLAVDSHLQTSDPSVFAAGDCAHLAANPRPKAGVYAVREAPILFHNLRVCLGADSGGTKAYRPQKDYLKLISLGDKSALAERFGTVLQGALMWRWKDHIDQTFMRQFRDLPAMPAPAVPRLHAADLREALGHKPMCGGCGAKVGRSALQGGLWQAGTPARDDITPLPGDDAAVVRLGDTRQVISTDHLRAVVADPVLMARIAAIHALGDIWAMGAQPHTATMALILPRLSPPLQQRSLNEITQVAREVMQDAGAEIVGGHSSLGDELTIGFTLTGLCETDPITLAGGRPGDALILAKPLGNGVVLAAEMAGQAAGADVIAAYQSMIQPQDKAARLLSRAHAMTDVTGFGLAGHLDGICTASGCGAMLALAAIPVLRGATELADAGVRSTIFAENRVIAPNLPEGGKADLLFDPQTCGGLLAALDPAEADGALKALRAAGYDAAIIGTLTDTPGLHLQN